MLTPGARLGHYEVIAAYRDLETRPLPGVIRDLMKASRLALEGNREEPFHVVEAFTQRHFDPEGLYFTARVFARLNERDASLDMLDRIVERGFSCPTIMLRDPWLDAIRSTPRFNEIVGKANARSRDAEAEFRRLGGEQLLAMTA